jgi:SAM-dependent methyltransferase
VLGERDRRRPDWPISYWRFKVSLMDAVRDRYDRYPYPPIPAVGLPARGQGRALSYETGTERIHGETRSHRGKRILVAGAGTFEAVLVGLVHPHAKEIIAVDISPSSTARLKKRLLFARIRHWLLGFGVLHKLPPMRVVCGDLATWEDGEFDYILATNVLHHHHDPAALLKRLAHSLHPDGLRRLVTYPKSSRFWLRATQDWLSSHGLHAETENLRVLCRETVEKLPEAHPIRRSYENNPETGKLAGLLDAYFHPCENPLWPLEWGTAVYEASLRWGAEDQAQSCRTTWLDTLVPQLTALHPWEKLQILDDLLELAVNPIIWLAREDEVPEARGPKSVPLRPARRAADPLYTPPGPGLPLVHSVTPEDIARGFHTWDTVCLWLPSKLRVELADGLRRAQRLTRPWGLNGEGLLETIRSQAGGHVAKENAKQHLRWHALHEYDANALFALPEPWDEVRWDALEKQLGPGVTLRLTDDDQPPSGDVGLAKQAARLQLRIGAESDWIGPLSLVRSDAESSGRGL